MLTLDPEPSMPDFVGTWPLVGRDGSVEQISELLGDGAGRAVVVAGPAGVGKSRLLSAAVLRLEDSGCVVARVTATRSASSIPFGALAPLLPVDDLLADSLVGLLQRAAKTITNRGSGSDVVLVVDDAHLLDDASAALVHQLALEGAVRVLLAIRAGEQVSASISSVVNESSTIIIELHSLTRPDLVQLAGAVLEGDVDGPVIQALWEGSHGNPLYVRELLVASAEDGSIQCEDGVWRLVRRPSVPGRLVELVDSRLATITVDERNALELLAVGHVIGRESLEQLTGTTMLSHFVQRGLVIGGRDGRRQPMRLHHPVYEEALRRGMSSRRLRATQLQLAELIQSTGMRRRQDLLLVTTLKLDAGGQLDLEMLEAAALDAYFALDDDLAERITRAGVAAGAGPRLRRILAEILRYQGHFEEAEAILSAIALRDVDERERTLCAVVRGENLFRGLGDRDTALRVLQEVQQTLRNPAWRDEVTAMTAVITALSGDVRTALASANPIIERGPSRAMSEAATAAVASLTFMGKADDASQLAQEAFVAASALAPQESQVVVAIHIMERCLGLLEAGHLAAAEAIGQMSYDWSLAGGHQVGQAWFSLLLGRAAQVGGRLEEAARRFRESALAFRDLRDHGIRRWALAGLAQTAASLGRAADAAVALDELDSAPPTAVQLLEAEVLRARGWLAIAKGTQTEGRRLLVEAASWASARGQHGLELTMLHDLVRIGGSRSAAADAAALAPEVQGPLAAARGLHGRGALDQDGAMLDEACEAFATLAANLFAAEAAAHAATAHRRAGHVVAAAASAARSLELAQRCDGASTPALVVRPSTAAEWLTPRELEIATLAARGFASREIAAQLSISIRTVDNQLQRAYSKLGISKRSELAARLAQS